MSLVAVQPKGTLPPLFLVHGVGGEVLSYSELSRLLGPNQPLYGFRSVGHDGSRPLLMTIEDQAAFYVQELVTHQPEGPYYLGGYSHGGRVAYEMAQQLARSGRTLAFLGIIDMWPGEGLGRQVSYPLEFMLNVPRWLWTDVRLEGWPKNRERLGRIWRVASKALTRLLRSRRANDGADRSVGDSINVSDLPDHIQRTYRPTSRRSCSTSPSPIPVR